MNKVGEVYYTGPLRITDQNGLPVTNLVSADFTSELFKNGAAVTGIGVTVNHLVNGNYQASFIPNAPGSWTIILYQSTYAPDGFGDETNVYVSQFRDITIVDLVTGTPNEILDALTPADFSGFFTRDFKYLPAYSTTKVYFKDDVVSLLNYGAVNFYKELLESSQGVSPIDITDPATWVVIQQIVDGYVQDVDIQKAYDQAKSFINIEIFEDNKAMVNAYLYCTAHFLVMDLRMAEEGIDSRSEGLINSKSVGGVSVSYDVPADMSEHATLSFFKQTKYGEKYLAYVQSRVIGLPTVAGGATLP